jgi:hypothetical protein
LLLRLIKLFYRAKKIDKDQFVQIYLEMTNGSCEKDLFTLDSKVVGFFLEEKNSYFTILIHCDRALVYNDRLMSFIFLKKNLIL